MDKKDFILIVCVAVAILLDIGTGLIKAFYKNEFKSSVMREGMFHKAGEIIVLAMLFGLEKVTPYLDVNIGLPLFSAGCGYAVLMELGSIIENLKSFTPGIDNIITENGGKKDE